MKTLIVLLLSSVAAVADVYVERVEGEIVAVYAAPQEGRATDSLPEDHAEVLAFRAAQEAAQNRVTAARFLESSGYTTGRIIALLNERLRIEKAGLPLGPKMSAVQLWLQGVQAKDAAGETDFEDPPHTYAETLLEAATTTPTPTPTPEP